MLEDNIPFFVAEIIFLSIALLLSLWAIYLTFKNCLYHYHVKILLTGILCLVVLSCIGGIGTEIILYFVTDDITSLSFRIINTILVTSHICSGPTITILIVERIIAIKYVNSYEDHYYGWGFLIIFITLYLLVYGLKFPNPFAIILLWFEMATLVIAFLSFLVLIYYIKRLNVVIRDNFSKRGIFSLSEKYQFNEIKTVTLRMVPLLTLFLLNSSASGLITYFLKYNIINKDILWFLKFCHKSNVVIKCISTSICSIHITLPKPINYYFPNLMKCKNTNNEYKNKTNPIDKSQNYFQQLNIQWQK